VAAFEKEPETRRDATAWGRSPRSQAPKGRDSIAQPNGLGNRKAPQGRDSTAQGIALGL